MSETSSSSTEAGQHLVSVDELALLHLVEAYRTTLMQSCPLLDIHVIYIRTDNFDLLAFGRVGRLIQEADNDHD